MTWQGPAFAPKYFKDFKLTLRFPKFLSRFGLKLWKKSVNYYHSRSLDFLIYKQGRWRQIPQYKIPYIKL